MRERAASLWQREEAQSRRARLIAELRRATTIRIDESHYAPLPAPADKARRRLTAGVRACRHPRRDRVAGPLQSQPERRRPAPAAPHRRAHRRGGTLLLRSLQLHAAAYLPETEVEVSKSPTPRRERRCRGASPSRLATASNGASRRRRPAERSRSTLRTLRLPDGSRTTQALVFNDLQLATYVWQPWFVQVRAGVGLLGERSRSRASGGEVTPAAPAAGSPAA